MNTRRDHKRAGARLPWWGGYAIAVLASVVTGFVRYLLASTLGGHLALEIFIIPIILSSCFGGFWPGLLATVLSAGIANYFFIEPYSSLSIQSASSFVHWVILIVVGTLISILTKLLRSPRSYGTAEKQTESTLLASFQTDSTSGDRVIRIAFVVALLFLGLVGMIYYWNVFRLADENQWVTHTNEVMVNLEAFLSRLTDVESGERGYTITGEDKFLEPYQTGTRESVVIFSRLKQLTADNATQQQRLATLAPILAERLDAALAVVNARKSEGFEGAQREVISGKGKELHDRIRAMIQEMMVTERELLASRSADARETSVVTRAVIAVGWLISMVCVGFAYFFIQRQLVQRARTRRVLEESEERLSSIVISAMDGIISVDEQQRILLFNASAEKMFGYSASEMLGQPLDRLIPEVLRVAHAGHIRKFAETHETSRTMGSLGTIFGLRASGEEFPIEAAISQIKVGRQNLFTAIVRDITERNRAEEEIRRAQNALEEREEQLSLYAKHSPVAIAMFDRDMKYLVASLRWMEEYRLDDGQPIIGRSHYEVFPEITQRWIEIHRRCLAGAVEKCDAESFTRSDGTIDWIRWEARPWRQADGSIGGIIIFSEDITERKCAEEVLRQSQERFRLSEERFRTIVNSIPQLAWVAKADGFIYWYNERWYEYTGTTLEEMEGWGWQSAHDPLVLPSVLERWKDSISTAEPFAMELPLRGSDGVFRTFLTRSVPLKDGEGHVLQWFGTNTDIEAQRRAEDRIRQLNTELEDRVIERTAQLQGANDKLHTEIIDRRRSEEAFRVLAELVPQLVWMCLPDGMNVYFNQRWVDYTGLSLEKSYGRGWNDPFIPTTSRPLGMRGTAQLRQAESMRSNVACAALTAAIVGF